VMIAGTTNTTVVPSGADFAAASWPTCPRPPAILDDAGLTHALGELRGQQARHHVGRSAGGNGTIQRIGFDGHALCA